jgi:TetR/AcrR family fatty acid metabolism transcriptional regulator
LTFIGVFNIYQKPTEHSVEFFTTRFHQGVLMSKRNLIIAAATRLFSRNGFRETSMSELSQITGAANGTIFHHFKNKEELFSAILKETKSDIESALKQHEQTVGFKNGMQMVESLVAFYLSLSGKLADQLLLLHRHYPYKIADTNPVVRTCLESVYTCLLVAFETAIKTGIQDGSIHTSSPRNSAMVLFAMIDGIARMNTYKLYHAGTLYQDIIKSCRLVLTGDKPIDRKVTLEQYVL